MVGEISSTPDPTPNTNPSLHSAQRGWLLRRLCSQNPFYLLSVCFVLHAVAHWYHVDSGVAFSPWPLLWVTGGYTLLLALTGFVIIRFGRVWDDARSILLIILLLFVQLSMIFDETLVNDPITGRTLLLLCWIFSAVLTEALLWGIRIELPILYRLPYHALLALLFLYPLSLISFGPQPVNETVVWRIFLFPTAASLVMLCLVPAIRRTSEYTRNNGTPWLWPWYPWSLFVFLGLCVCFRSYGLCQSFDPVLGESTQSAMNYTSAFGMYFLIPMFFAAGVLLQEIGLVEKRNGTVFLSQLVPLFCLWISIPAATGSGPYFQFVYRLTTEVGLPVWLTLILTTGFYCFAALRGIRSAEVCLSLALLVLTRIGQHNMIGTMATSTEWWPFVALSVIHAVLGLRRRDSRLVLLACFAATAASYLATNSIEPSWVLIRQSMVPASLIISTLIVAAIFRDDFAWLLRLIGAPVLVITTIAGIVVFERHASTIPVWVGFAFVGGMTLLAWTYSYLVRMPLYQLASLLCAGCGTLGLSEMAAVYFIRESGWRGATSFVTGLTCFAVAATISSWKAGWLKELSMRLRGVLVVPVQ